MHGYDLLPTFWYSGVDLQGIIKKLDLEIPSEAAYFISQYMAKFAPNYQSRFVGHAITGDPNKYIPKSYVQWPTATSTCIPSPGARMTAGGSCPAGSVSAINNVAFALYNPIFHPETFFKIQTDTITTDDRRAFWTDVAGIVMGNCTTNGAGERDAEKGAKKL